MRGEVVLGSLKRASFACLDRLGVSRRVGRSAWRRNRLLILCYHGISLTDEHAWWPGLYVSPSHLADRLALLERHRCNVLPLGEAIQRLYANDLPDRAVVLTFDDGYYDFRARAWPLLRQHGFPATVYLTTERVDRGLPIVNLFLRYAFWCARDRAFEPDGLFGLGGSYPLATEQQRGVALQRLLAAFEANRPAGLRRDDMVKLAVQQLGIDYDALLARRVLTLLRPDEVTQLAAEGVQFQLHTHLHRTPADPDEFVRGVLTNRARIEALTGASPQHLCYPSGNYRPEYLPALERIGVVSATTCDPGLASPGSHPLLLPRFIDTSSVAPIVFEAWLTGLADRLPRRTRRGGDVAGTPPVAAAPLARPG